MHNEHASKGKGILDREEAVVNALLSDSDISNRKKLILGEAKKAWEVGKRLGFSIRGDDREVVVLKSKSSGIFDGEAINIDVIGLYGNMSGVLKLIVHLVENVVWVDIDFRVKLESVVGTSLRSIANKIVFQWEPSPSEWMNFYVAGVVMEDEAGCGGVLSNEKGVACALFFGLIEAI
ncbi:hypothetical protein Gotur_015458, partial [Gossypium turneri]